MTKRDYIAFASLFAGELATLSPTSRVRHKVRGIILSTADIFARGNPRFDRGTFYLACGLTEDGFFEGQEPESPTAPTIIMTGEGVEALVERIERRRAEGIPIYKVSLDRRENGFAVKVNEGAWSPTL